MYNVPFQRKGSIWKQGTHLKAEALLTSIWNFGPQKGTQRIGLTVTICYNMKQMLRDWHRSDRQSCNIRENGIYTWLTLIYIKYIKKASPYHQFSMFSQVLAPKLPASRLTSLLSSCAHAPAQVHVPICSMIMAAWMQPKPSFFSFEIIDNVNPAHATAGCFAHCCFNVEDVMNIRRIIHCQWWISVGLAALKFDSITD